MKYTPYDLLFGRSCNIPGILQSNPQPLYNYDDIVQVIKNKMQISYKIAKERLEKFKQKQQARTQANPIVFKENDLVLLEVEKRGKLDPLYTGPFEIKNIRESNANIQEVGKRKHLLVYTNGLKSYFSTVAEQELKNKNA